MTAAAPRLRLGLARRSAPRSPFGGRRGGPCGIVRRSGCSCVSHGTSGRSGGRVRTGGGLTPTIGSSAEPKMPLPRFSVSAPPEPRTLNHGPLASNERLSPARPGSDLATSW